MLSDELLHSDICHLLISGVGVKIATDILYVSDGCHFKLPVSRENDMWQYVFLDCL